MNILIIGGTGMLREASDYFIENNDEVHLIARTENTLENIRNQHLQYQKNIHLHPFDYSNRKDLDAFLSIGHPFDKAIIWMHSYALDSFHILLDSLVGMNPKIKIFHLKGSSLYKSDSPHVLEISEHIIEHNYHDILLGFKIENGKRRWLSNKEISAGTLEAVSAEKKRHIIGQIA